MGITRWIRQSTPAKAGFMALADPHRGHTPGPRSSCGIPGNTLVSRSQKLRLWPIQELKLSYWCVSVELYGTSRSSSTNVGQTQVKRSYQGKVKSVNWVGSDFRSLHPLHRTPLHCQPQLTTMVSLKRRLVLAAVSSLLLLSPLSVAANGEAEVSSSGEVKDSPVGNAARTSQEDEKGKFDIALKNAEKMSWGPAYDPQEVFCGEYDCYSILGFDSTDPSYVYDKKAVSKSYRTLSRVYHPDKARGNVEEAKKRFLYIQRAEGTLSNETMREEYAYYRDRPQEYHRKYGAGLRTKFAPQTSAVLIVAVLLTLFSCVTWAMRSSKYDSFIKNNNLVEPKAAFRNIPIPDDKPWSEGGRSELVKAVVENIIACSDRSVKPSTGPVPPAFVSHHDAFKPSSDKLSAQDLAKERRNHCFAFFASRLVRKVYPDFKAGYRVPRLPDDLFAYQLIRFPYDAFVYVAANDDKSKSRRKIGATKWDVMSEEEQARAIGQQLWIQKNYEAWLTEEEKKTGEMGISKTQRKRMDRSNR